MNTLKTNASLILFNGMGSTYGTSFAKGTPIAEIVQRAQEMHDRSVEQSTRMDGSDIYSRPRLYSDATGKELATAVEIQHRTVAPRVEINYLSGRQKEVFSLRHLTDTEIAQRIGCSPASVANYRRDALERSARTSQASPSVTLSV